MKPKKFEVISQVLGVHSAYDSFVAAEAQVSKLNAKLFDKIVLDAIFDESNEAIITLKYKRMLNDAYEQSKYIVEEVKFI